MTAAPDDPKVVPLKRKRRAEAEEGWYGRLLKSPSTGKAIDCIENVRLVLLGDPCFADRLHYNELRECVVADSVPWHGTNRLRDWVDRDDIELAAWCQRHGLIVKPPTCAAAVHSVACANPVHPLRDRLDVLEWDGVQRIDEWLIRYLGVVESGYSKAVGRKWLIAAVARVYSPGCKADTLLILEGGQGIGKSTACSVLALDPEWFSDEIADFTSKDASQDLAGKWIIELAELSALTTRRVEMERVKAFFSRSVSRYRPSYGRRSQDFPRRCIFIGTTNSDEYLTDPTGGRRFWPNKVGRIDIAALRRDVELLWAEAIRAYRAGETWWLSSSETPDAAGEQEKRRKVDAWERDVLRWAQNIFNEGSDVTVGALLERAIGLELKDRDQRASTRVGNILTGAGWIRRQKRRDGVHVRYYLPSQPVTPDEEDGCYA